MKNKLSPVTIRIGDNHSLSKKRRVNSSAGCYLIRKKEKIQLLVIKKEWPDGNIKYVLPKGHVENNETLEQAAIREVREESGYTEITLLKYLGSSTYKLDWKEIQMKTDHYFLALLNNDTQKEKQAETYENGVVVQNQWIDLDKGLELLTLEKHKEIHELVKKYVEELNKN